MGKVGEVLSARASKGDKTVGLLSGTWMVLAGCISASGAYAQTDTASDTAVLEAIIVTAQKRAEPLQDVPISISVLSGAALDQTPIRGVSDALALVPGISISESTHAGGGLV